MARVAGEAAWHRRRQRAGSCAVEGCVCASALRCLHGGGCLSSRPGMPAGLLLLLLLLPHMCMATNAAGRCPAITPLPCPMYTHTHARIHASAYTIAHMPHAPLLPCRACARARAVRCRAHRGISESSLAALAPAERKAVVLQALRAFHTFQFWPENTGACWAGPGWGGAGLGWAWVRWRAGCGTFQF